MVPVSTFSCEFSKRHWKNALNSVNIVTRHVLLSRVFHGAGRRLIKETTAQCILSILTYLLPSPLTTLTSTNKTKQVRNNEEPWILSLLWLHHLFLRWEMMERRAGTLLHIRHVIYTALDSLGQQRETGFLRQCFRKSSATAGIRITGHRVLRSSCLLHFYLQIFLSSFLCYHWHSFNSICQLV